jgi:putative PIN family toxin of toxin-antitoxin system
MAIELRFVLDTNVLLSAAFDAASRSGQALEFAANRLAFSQETWRELVLTITRPKFARYLPPGAADRLLEKIHPAEFVLAKVEVRACRDPHDDKFFALAQACNAAAIVTGDRDLLVIKRWAGTPILSPADFLAQFSETH